MLQNGVCCVRLTRECTWPFWPEKIHLHAWRFATLIPFEVVSLWLNTLLPAVPPLFEAFLEYLFVNGVQMADVFRKMSSRDSSPVPFSCVFRWRNSQKIARSHVGRVGSPLNHINVVWPRQFESVARNRLVRCHDAAATFPLLTGQVSCVAQHHEGDEGLPSTIPC
jgi:hypothetical protein